MNLHNPQLSEKIADLALYLIILLVTCFIWLSLAIPTAQDQRLLDSNVTAGLAMLLPG